MELLKQCQFGLRVLVAILRKRSFYLHHVTYFFKQIFYRRFSHLVLTGEERSSGSIIRVHYFGERTSLGYLKTIIFRSAPEESIQRKFSLVEVIAGLGTLSKEFDLRVCEYTPRILKLIGAQSRFRTPEWIEQEITLDGSWDDVVGRFRKNTRSTDLRLVRKYGFTYDVVTDRGSIEYFYRHLYLPYVSQRFQEAAQIIDQEWLVNVAMHSGLLRILNNDIVVAGAVLHYGRHHLDWIWVGALAQNSGEKEKGIFSSLYFHSIRHAHDSGFPLMKIGNTRPFLTDGVYRYKRKWGARLARGRYADTALLFDFNFDSSVCRQWLTASPFLTEESDGFHANFFAFLGSGDADQLVKQIADFVSPGLCGINVYSANPIIGLPDSIESCRIRQVNVNDAAFSNLNS